MKNVEITSEFIKLSQLLKLGGLVGQGSDAKILIADGLVTLNGNVVTERGKKIRHDDIVELKGEEPIKVVEVQG